MPAPRIPTNLKLHNPMLVTRTFHPVGHGAFYTEKIQCSQSGKTYNIVYDCGSRKTKEINAAIDAAFAQGEKIDILFLSHFHNDHINGLEYLNKRCKIGTVIVPYMTRAMRCLALLSFVTAGGYATRGPSLRNWAVSYLSDPEQSSGQDDTGFKVLTLDNGNLEQQELSIEEIGKYLRLPASTRIILNLDGSHEQWYLKTYCHRSALNENIFYEAVKKAGMDCSRLLDPQYVWDHRKKLRKIYDGQLKDKRRKSNIDCRLHINNTSIVLFSGMKPTDFLIKLSRLEPVPVDILHYYCLGCLYTGDIQMQQGNGITNALISCFGNEINNRLICTVQVPHHGAENACDPDFWNCMKSCATNAVVSCNPPDYPCSKTKTVIQNYMPKHSLKIVDKTNSFSEKYPSLKILRRNCLLTRL